MHACMLACLLLAHSDNSLLMCPIPCPLSHLFSYFIRTFTLPLPLFFPSLIHSLSVDHFPPLSVHNFPSLTVAKFALFPFSIQQPMSAFLALLISFHRPPSTLDRCTSLRLQQPPSQPLPKLQFGCRSCCDFHKFTSSARKMVVCRLKTCRLP